MIKSLKKLSNEYLKLAQQINFEYGKNTSDEKWATYYDKVGPYLVCYECERKVRMNEIHEDTVYELQKKNEYVKSADIMSEEEKSIIDNSFSIFKNNINNEIMSAFNNAFVSSDSLFYVCSEIDNKFRNIFDNYFKDVFAISQKYKLNINVEKANDFILKIRNFLRDMDDSIPNKFWRSKEEKEQKEEIKKQILNELNKRIQFLPNLLNDFYKVISDSFGKSSYEQQTVHYKHPLCDQCEEEITMCCEKDDCDYCSLDEDDFVEVKIRKWKNNKVETSSKLFCKENNHGNDCEICEKGLEVGNDEHIEHEEKHYHSDCFYEKYRYCDLCSDIFPVEEMVYNETSEQEICSNCYREDEDSESIDSKIDEGSLELFIDTDISEYTQFQYPLDASIIEGNIIPVLTTAYKKFADWDDKATDWILKRIQKPDAKAAVKQEIESSGKEALESFKNNLEVINSFKQKYPNLKGYRPLPVNVKMKSAATGHEGTVIAIYPNDKCLDMAESVMPHAKFVYNKYLSRIGHHSGALGYVRLSESDNNIIIDNLQTDLDKQSDSIKTLVDRHYVSQEYKDLKNSISTLTNELERNRLSTKIKREEKIKKFEELSSKIKDLQTKLENTKEQVEEIDGRTRKDVDKALNWWYKSIDKFYAPFLLDTVKQFANDSGMNAYLTPFEMQLKKWRRLPDRNKDIYEKLPEMMGMNGKRVNVKPESLPSDEWQMWKVAKLKKLSDAYLKYAIRTVQYDPNYHSALKEQEAKMEPEDRFGEAQEYGRTKNFDIREFEQIRDPLQARLYAHRRLQHLGSGSSRAVYVYSPKLALKIATNTAGMAQNELEEMISKDSDYDQIIAKVVRSSSNNNFWILSELVHPISVLEDDGEISYNDQYAEIEEFNKHSPINFHTMQQGIDSSYESDYDEEEYENYENYKKNAPPQQASIVDERIRQAKALIDDYGLKIQDIRIPSNWGRTADGRMVILDYGFDDQVYGSYYAGARPENWSLDYDDRRYPIDETFK